MIETFIALAEPNRLRIVELLRASPRVVGEIAELLDVRQPQVSKHLNTLKKAGLVTVQAEAQRRVYELRTEPLEQLDVWLESYRQLWTERFAEFDLVLADIQKRKGKQ